MMEQHALDLLHLALWIVIAMGGAGITVLGWGGKKVLTRLDSIEQMLTDEVRTLREYMHGLDVRVTKIEERHHLMDRIGNHPKAMEE
jgi:hypothetical protein